MTDPALPHRSADDAPPDDTTDPSTKFGEIAAQVKVAVDRPDDRPSIARLQRTFATPHALTRAEVIAQMDAAPALLEIAAAAMDLREHGKSAARLRHALREKYAPRDEDYAMVDAADTKLASRQAAFDAALSKVRS